MGLREEPADVATFPETAPLELSPAGGEDAQAWDDFVDRHSEGHFCHLWGFRRVLEDVYGYRCVYRNILLAGRRVGLFPSIVVKRGHGRLVSQPFNEYGGPLADSLSASQSEQLARSLLTVAREENCRSVEIRGGVGCESLIQTGYAVRHPLHLYGILALDEEERLWRESLSNEARKGVNRARNAGLVAEIRRGVRAVQAPFYSLYLASMKRLGVPPHPERFFVQLGRAFGQRLVAAWVTRQTDVAAVLLAAVCGHRIHVFVTASAPEYWDKRPNDLAHWQMMTWAFAAGLRLFDFGSARYPGQVQFKKKWGTRFYEYSFYLVGPPDSVARLRIETPKTSTTMGVLAKLWRWVVPTPLTPLIGPPIRKYLTK